VWDEQVVVEDNRYINDGTIGGVLGGVAGGVIGNQIGKGRGNTAAQ